MDWYLAKPTTGTIIVTHETELHNKAIWSDSMSIFCKQNILIQNNNGKSKLSTLHEIWGLKQDKTIKTIFYRYCFKIHEESENISVLYCFYILVIAIIILIPAIICYAYIQTKYSI